MPRVSIITRTRSRGVYLARAARSVASQTFTDYEWIIVNDGGEPAEVEATACQSGAARYKVVHHDVAQGRWPAAVSGMAAAQGDCAVLHDDDDSWHPHFLERTVHPLKDPAVPGVMSATLAIVEKTGADGQPRELRRYVHHDAQQVDLLNLALFHNVPAPICFVFRRQAYERVGGYDSSLPVLGDWEFLLRFLQAHEVFLLHRQFFARYHLRPHQTGVGGNSILANSDIHHQTISRLRNRWLREDLTAGRFGLGSFINLAAAQGQLQQEIKLLGFVSTRVVELLKPLTDRLSAHLHGLHRWDL